MSPILFDVQIYKGDTSKYTTDKKNSKKCLLKSACVLSFSTDKGKRKKRKKSKCKKKCLLQNTQEGSIKELLVLVIIKIVYKKNVRSTYINKIILW